MPLSAHHAGRLSSSAASYHSPKARYCDSELKSQLTRDIEVLLNKSVDLGKIFVLLITIIITFIRNNVQNTRNRNIKNKNKNRLRLLL